MTYTIQIRENIFLPNSRFLIIFFAKRNISKNAMHHYNLGIFGYQFWLSLGIIGHTCPEVNFFLSFRVGGVGGGGVFIIINQ